jgi:uncharacterized protein (DUF4415 family)
MPNNKEIIMLDGSRFEDTTDYKRLASMTQEELLEAAKSDPDAQPLTDEHLLRFRRLPDVPGGNFIDRVRALPRENKTLLSVRYDNDVVCFFKSRGKGYQRLMNNVLRAYMEAHQEADRGSQRA